MTYVPQPVLDRVRVEVKSDGRYGIEDPIQWPQLFSSEYCHYALILRRPTDPKDHRQPIWWNLTKQDFIPIHGSAVSFLGTLAPGPRRQLERLVSSMSLKIASYVSQRGGPPTYINFCDLSMRAAMSCLTFPSTYRDICVQVVNVQRYWLEAEAYLEYMNSYRNRFLDTSTFNCPPPQPSDIFMGTYTADPVAAFKLFKAGIPVWLVRSPEAITSDIAIKEIVRLSYPTEIEAGYAGFGQLVYVGQVGERHHAALNRGGHTYMDIPKVFLSNTSDANANPNVTTSQPSHAISNPLTLPQPTPHASSSNQTGATRDFASSPNRTSGSKASSHKVVRPARSKIRDSHAPCMSIVLFVG